MDVITIGKLRNLLLQCYSLSSIELSFEKNLSPNIKIIMFGRMILNRVAKLSVLNICVMEILIQKMILIFFTNSISDLCVMGGLTKMYIKC